MESIMETERIKICYTESVDLEEIMRIEGQEENKKFVYVWSRERHLQAINASDEMHLVIKEKKQEKILGYILLAGLDGEDKSIELRRITIAEKGKGYGRESMRLVKKLCFEKLECHRLWLDLFEDNGTAHHLYVSEGFVKEGVLRECKRYNNSYRSMILMSMLDREYRKINEG